MHNQAIQTSHRLTRSPNGLAAGVCGGLAKYLGIEPIWLRLGWMVAVLAFGTGLLAYLVLWWLMPRADQVPIEPTLWETNSKGHKHPPLMRTSEDRKMLGVCGGLARRWNVDPTFVRLGALTVFTLSGGLALLAYGIAALVMDGPEGETWNRHPVEL